MSRFLKIALLVIFALVILWAIYRFVMKPLGFVVPAITKKAKWKRTYTIDKYAAWIEYEATQNNEWAKMVVSGEGALKNAISAYDFGELATQPAGLAEFESWYETHKNRLPATPPPPGNLNTYFS